MKITYVNRNSSGFTGIDSIYMLQDWEAKERRGWIGSLRKDRWSWNFEWNWGGAGGQISEDWSLDRLYRWSRDRWQPKSIYGFAVIDPGRLPWRTCCQAVEWILCRVSRTRLSVGRLIWRFCGRSWPLSVCLESAWIAIHDWDMYTGKPEVPLE